MQRANQNFEVWDRATPRNYDQTWLSPRSLDAFEESSFTIFSDEEQNQIIETFYRELKGDIQESDYDGASQGDEYYFDRENRIFYVEEAAISFYVPEKIEPHFSISSGEFSGGFSIPDHPNCSFYL